MAQVAESLRRIAVSLAVSMAVNSINLTFMAGRKSSINGTPICQKPGSLHSEHAGGKFKV